MAAPEPGAKVAKDLGIYLGQVYGYIKKGLVTNHKVGGYPEGKGVEVDPDEVRAAMSQSRRRGGKGGGKAKSTSRARGSSDSAAAEQTKKARREKFPVGQIVSNHGGITPAKDYGYKVRVITGRYRSLTYLSADDRHTMFSTEKMRDLLAKDIIHLENPIGILGMVMFHWITNDQLELAAGLEAWMEKHGLEVSIPEPVILDDDGVATEAEEADDEDDDAE